MSEIETLRAEVERLNRYAGEQHALAMQWGKEAEQLKLQKDAMFKRIVETRKLIEEGIRMKLDRGSILERAFKFLQVGDLSPMEKTSNVEKQITDTLARQVEIEVAQRQAAEKEVLSLRAANEVLLHSESRVGIESLKKELQESNRLISDIKAALLKYCYCGHSRLPSVDAEGRAGTAPVADTCRIHYALADIASIEGKSLRPKRECHLGPQHTEHDATCGGFTEKRIEPTQKSEPCPHSEWFVDGDRDVCKRCGSRLNA